jgi:hypothetical protein
MKIKTLGKAGCVNDNHDERLSRDLKVRSLVQACALTNNHIEWLWMSVKTRGAGRPAA